MKIDWEQIQKACDNIARQSKIFEPDCIVAVSRGGLIPARIVAESLNISHVYSMGLTSYKEDNTQGKITMYQSPLSEIKKNKHKLAIVVDEIADTGNTFKFISAQWSKGCKDTSCIFTTMYVKEHCELVPSIYHKKIANSDWLIFPWEANY